MINKNKYLSIGLAVAMLTACTPSKPKDTAPTQAKDSIKARQDLMYRWGKSHKAIQAMTKEDKASFDVDELKSN